MESDASDGELDTSSSGTANSNSIFGEFDYMASSSEDAEPVDFDTALPVEHNYLGENLEELRGRTLLDDGSVHVLPMLTQASVILVPGQTLPLMVFYPPTVNMLRNLVTSNGTFGVLFVRYFTGSNPQIANVGTTAEIYEFCHEQETAGFRIKAKGRQRFRVVDTEELADGNLQATIKILPEIVLPDSLYEQRLMCLDRYRSELITKDPHSPQAERRLKCQNFVTRTDALMTPWPSWVHKLYNAKSLAQRVKSHLSYLKSGGTSTTAVIPSDPAELSFWVAQAMPLIDDKKLELMRINSPIQRLRWELSVLEKYQMLVCRDCEAPVADPKEAFSMSVEGPQGTYVNPGGFVHETLTVYKAKGLKCVNEEPSTECSWFPGYAWTIAECKYCSKHMGWKYTATNKALKPQKFWGICRRSILTRLVTDDEDVQPIL